MRTVIMDTFSARQTAQRVLRAALKVVDPKEAVKNYLHHQQTLVAQIKASSGRLIVVGAGKASAPMVDAVIDIFANRITTGTVIVKYEHIQPTTTPSTIDIVEAGHPVPDEAGLRATQDIISLLKDTTANDTVLCLISGGGSALLTAPAPGITLADLQATNQTLLAAGATINQINTIRKHLSTIKGGRLAELAAPAKVYSLILSDVVGDPLEVIASGPTVPDPTTFNDAWGIVNYFQLEHKLPHAVINHLQAGIHGKIPDTPKPNTNVFKQVTNAIIGSNRLAAQAAVNVAHKQGWQAQLLTTFVEGEAKEVGIMLAGLAKGIASGENNLKRPACLILGGETTVTLRGDGLGGRNQETALSAALSLAGWSNSLIACFGTDGNDGPTDAAGAFADGATVAKAEALGLNPTKHLYNNDAYNLFSMLDDLILTGPTNTNVNDLMLIMVW